MNFLIIELDVENLVKIATPILLSNGFILESRKEKYARYVHLELGWVVFASKTERLSEIGFNEVENPSIIDILDPGDVFKIESERYVKGEDYSFEVKEKLEREINSRKKAIERIVQEIIQKVLAETGFIEGKGKKYFIEPKSDFSDKSLLISLIMDDQTREIVQKYMIGLTNKQIAESMNVSVGMVKNTLTSVRKAFGDKLPKRNALPSRVKFKK
jgi:hypothetical protein